ncbi:MAG: transporter [Geminicoccaceae bacterium]|nr:MAG: transporter [Geminicoccaceae bacterium]
MVLDLETLLAADAILLTFVVIGLGMALGRLHLGPVPVGSTAGVLVTGLVFGHLGFLPVPSLTTIGFTLFIFCVGVQAGPRFFNVLIEDGRRYVTLALLAALTGSGLALGLGYLIAAEPGMTVGMLAGALTSTPTLVGAQDAIRSGRVELPAGLDAAAVLSNVGVAYAITYLFGTIGILFAIRLLPRVVGLDLQAEAAKLARQQGMVDDEAPIASPSLPLVRAYRLPDSLPAEGLSIHELQARSEDGFAILRIRRGEAVIEPTGDFLLLPGDVVSGIATLRANIEAQTTLGQEVLDPELLNFKVTSREIVVTSQRWAGRNLGSLEMPTRFGCFADRLTRSGFAVPFSPATVLARADRLRVTGEERRLRELAEEIGYVEREVEASDSLTLAFGIALGLLIGTIVVQIGGLQVGLGAAGGLLLVGILVGFARSVHPTFGLMPPAARAVLMDLGLMLFMAGIGLGAGGGIVDALARVGPQLFLAGVVVTLTPIVLLYAVGRGLMKMNPVLLLGAICGAMTSTPALAVVNAVAGNGMAALGYAGTYTFANVFLTFAGTILAAW